MPGAPKEAGENCAFSLFKVPYPTLPLSLSWLTFESGLEAAEAAMAAGGNAQARGTTHGRCGRGRRLTRQHISLRPLPRVPRQ